MQRLALILREYRSTRMFFLSILGWLFLALALTLFSAGRNKFYELRSPQSSQDTLERTHSHLHQALLGLQLLQFRTLSPQNQPLELAIQKARHDADVLSQSTRQKLNTLAAEQSQLVSKFTTELMPFGKYLGYSKTAIYQLQQNLQTNPQAKFEVATSVGVLEIFQINRYSYFGKSYLEIRPAANSPQNFWNRAWKLNHMFGLGLDSYLDSKKQREFIESQNTILNRAQAIHAVYTADAQRIAFKYFANERNTLRSKILETRAILTSSQRDLASTFDIYKNMYNSIVRQIYTFGIDFGTQVQDAHFDTKGCLLAESSESAEDKLNAYLIH